MLKIDSETKCLKPILKVSQGTSFLPRADKEPAGCSHSTPFCSLCSVSSLSGAEPACPPTSLATLTLGTLPGRAIRFASVIQKYSENGEVEFLKNIIIPGDRIRQRSLQKRHRADTRTVQPPVGLTREGEPPVQPFRPGPVGSGSDQSPDFTPEL